MAKDQGPKGPQGIPGPPGPAGHTGSRGIRGTVGATGKHGASGARGAKGATGKTGKESKPTVRRRSRLVKDVHRHIDNIYRELRVQLVRMSQIQMEVDELRSKMKNL